MVDSYSLKDGKKDRIGYVSQNVGRFEISAPNSIIDTPFDKKIRFSIFDTKYISVVYQMKGIGEGNLILVL